jgi:flagellar motor switch protein FliM
VVLSAIKDTWAPLQDISTEALATEGRVDLVDIGGESDPVICTRFDVSVAGQQSLFRVVWPMKMVEPVLPVFEGQKGERDAVEDLRWAQAIRRRLADSVVGLTSNVGHARMSLGDLVRLSPGDIVEIESPQEATVMASDVPLIHGRLGVHQGRNAIETIEWVDRQ